MSCGYIAACVGFMLDTCLRRTSKCSAPGNKPEEHPLEVILVQHDSDEEWEVLKGKACDTESNHTHVDVLSPQ